MMITQSRDSNTGIYRFEIGTVNAEACRNEVEASGFVKFKDGVADTVNYGVVFKDCEIHVTSTPTRTLLFGLNRYALQEFYELIKGDERIGTFWAYDDSKRSDYDNGKA